MHQHVLSPQIDQPDCLQLVMGLLPLRRAVACRPGTTVQKSMSRKASELKPGNRVLLLQHIVYTTIIAWTLCNNAPVGTSSASRKVQVPSLIPAKLSCSKNSPVADACRGCVALI